MVKTMDHYKNRSIYTTLGDSNILLIVPNGLPSGNTLKKQHFLTTFALQLGKQLQCYSVINDKYKATLVDFSNMQAVKQRKKLTDSFLLHIKRFSDEIVENDLKPLVFIFQTTNDSLPDNVNILLGYGQGQRGDDSKPHSPTIAPSFLSKIRVAMEDQGFATGIADSASPYCGREQDHINQMFRQKNYLEGFYKPEVQSLLVTIPAQYLNSEDTAIERAKKLSSSLLNFKEKMPLVRKVSSGNIDTTQATDLQYIFRIHRDTQYNELARETYIEELANSIKKNGLLHPLVLLQKTDGRYKVLCGFRRFQALQRLKAEWVEAKVFAEKNFTTADFFNISLAENTKRRNLNPVEIGNFLDSASTSLNLNNTMLAEQFGETLGIGQPGQKVSHTTIHKYRKVHQIRSRGESPEIINDLINEKLQFSIAAEILAPIKSPADRDSLYIEVVKTLAPTRPQIIKILNLLKQKGANITDTLHDERVKTLLTKAMESKQPATSFIRSLEQEEKPPQEDSQQFKTTVKKVREKYFGKKASKKDFDLKKEQKGGSENIALTLRINKTNYQEIFERVTSILENENILSQ
ncbi:MAG: hypothetical protein CSB34_01000 [Desulfobulbus propionicus]|nr:MAG: hypothetical protein CSB34_01000 [Desulfobulbus propionicus]